jgi:hypothetical protein
MFSSRRAALEFQNKVCDATAVRRLPVVITEDPQLRAQHSLVRAGLLKQHLLCLQEGMLRETRTCSAMTRRQRHLTHVI